MEIMTCPESMEKIKGFITINVIPFNMLSECSRTT
jgi:hypothetical protein